MTAPTVVERSAHERGFAPIFAEEIAPERAHRGAHRRNLRTLLRHLGVSAAVIGLVVFGVLALPVALETTLKVLPTLNVQP